MSKEFVFAVETGSVGPQKPFHASDEIGKRRFDHEVKMIAHQAIGVHLPAGLFARFSQGRQKAVAVVVVLEDVFAATSAIDEVIDGSGIFDSELARHQHSATNVKHSLSTSWIVED